MALGPFLSNLTFSFHQSTYVFALFRYDSTYGFSLFSKECILMERHSSATYVIDSGMVAFSLVSLDRGVQARATGPNASVKMVDKLQPHFLFSFCLAVALSTLEFVLYKTLVSETPPIPTECTILSKDSWHWQLAQLLGIGYWCIFLAV
ncbi:hypothetical protein O6H91_Y335300 [Diphasiastrum complanatum]|nr:hypothetical protein O6H91_Y335300 [Diphasiastrum complanatum]